MTFQPDPQLTTHLSLASSDDQRKQFSLLLKGAFVPTFSVGVVISVICAFINFSVAGSAALGAAIVLFFFAMSLLGMRQAVHLPPHIVLAIVLGIYFIKIVVLAIALFVLSDISWVSVRALGLTTITCSAVWLAMELRAFKRLRLPIISALESIK
ncbi:MAG: hypothetical protein ACRCTR_01400 [Actinomycetota bacterium]